MSLNNLTSIKHICNIQFLKETKHWINQSQSLAQEREIDPALNFADRFVVNITHIWSGTAKSHSWYEIMYIISYLCTLYDCEYGCLMRLRVRKLRRGRFQ